MSWKECDRVSARLEFVKLADVEGANKSELCRRFGVARKTGDKWLRRWKAEGEAGLHDRPRTPRSSPGRTRACVEQAVVAVRKEHPTWGGRKIRRRLLNLGHRQVPAASTITSILRRRGLLSDERCSASQRWQRLNAASPTSCGRWTSKASSHWPEVASVIR